MMLMVKIFFMIISDHGIRTREEEAFPSPGRASWVGAAVATDAVDTADVKNVRGAIILSPCEMKNVNLRVSIAHG
jgi:hypothetical protein